MGNRTILWEKVFDFDTIWNVFHYYRNDYIPKSHTAVFQLCMSELRRRMFTRTIEEELVSVVYRPENVQTLLGL